MRLIIVVFVTLLTAGCLSPIPEDARFLLNGKTEEQFRRDSLECERDAIQVANATLFDNGRVFYRRCMWTRGYQQIGEEAKYPITPEQRNGLATAAPASPARDRAPQMKSSLSEAGPLVKTAQREHQECLFGGIRNIGVRASDVRAAADVIVFDCQWRASAFRTAMIEDGYAPDWLGGFFENFDERMRRMVMGIILDEQAKKR